MSISGIGQNEYRSNASAAAKQVNQNNLSGTFMVSTSNSDHAVLLAQDALFSICHAPTGESANVYRAEGYSEENPVYLVKGTDKNGEYYEEMIDVSKVDPNHCSYTELLALNAHVGNTASSSFLSMAILKGEAGDASIHEPVDYLSLVRARMEDLKTLGCWDDYLRYDKWVNDIVNYCKNKGYMQF